MVHLFNIFTIQEEFCSRTRDVDISRVGEVSYQEELLDILFAPGLSQVKKITSTDHHPSRSADKSKSCSVRLLKEVVMPSSREITNGRD